MEFRSREQQTGTERRVRYNFVFPAGNLSDEILDGIVLPRTSGALKWIKENTVHQALKLTSRATRTASFLSTQAIAVRDEVRRVSHVATDEIDGLYLSKVRDAEVLERRRITDRPVVRFSLCLRKFDGHVVAIYCTDTDIFLNGNKLVSNARQPDFVNISIDQPPIGNFATTAPRLGAISYKCRETGTVFVRQMDPMTLEVGAELVLPKVRVLGGADIVCFDGKLYIRVDDISNDRIVPSLASANLSAMAAPTQYTPIDLSKVPHSRVLPAMSGSSIDHTGNYHVPVVVGGEKDILLDILPGDDLAVAAIERPHIGASALNVFPSKPGIDAALRPGFGDGVLDGNGIIASVGSDGDLYASNSQSGGYSYPSSSLLNHDMPKLFCFRATQCYTRGITPDVVSMDYVFVEADADGHPTENSIWLETWDMPLPKPQLVAKLENNKVVATLVKQGWFFPGKTSVELSDKSVSITGLNIIEGRKLEISVDRPPAAGTTVSFETRSEFYFHSGRAEIS
jgi:hypothetical protein